MWSVVNRIPIDDVSSLSDLVLNDLPLFCVLHCSWIRGQFQTRRRPPETVYVYGSWQCQACVSVVLLFQQPCSGTTVPPALEPNCQLTINMWFIGIHAGDPFNTA
uniref:Uncharacterized protein n=1 Tax=Octopus bimaculoides TaxID=37653 RepID=A0A0L8H1X1_OCTBM